MDWMLKSSDIFQKLGPAIVNMGLVGFYFLCYLLYVAIMTGTFTHAYGVSTEGGWILTAMWLGWIASIIVVLGSISILAIAIQKNKEKKTKVVVTTVYN